MTTQSYVPLRMLIPWPDDIFPELRSEFSVLDRIGIEDFSYSNKNGTEMSVDAVILTELSLGYSGLEGWELVFGSNEGLTSVQAKLSFGEKTVLTIENFEIQLRIPQNVLKKMKRESGTFVEDKDDQGE